MTKSELINRIAERFPALTTADTNMSVELILQKMMDSLARGNRIEIRKFGSFSLNYRPPRPGWNPKTGKEVAVPTKHVPHFKAGKALREGVDRSRDADAPAPERPNYALNEYLKRIQEGPSADPG